jgi:hypothetical protein
MPVILRQSVDLPGEGDFERWCAAGGAAAGPSGSPKVKDLAGRLEGAFEAIRDRWWELGRLLSVTPSAELAHMPTCGTYSSDFGIMLAWARLVEALAVETPNTLVVCDDPWLFHHLTGRSGVNAGKPPGLWMKTMTLRLRGFLARCRVAARLVAAALASRRIKAARKTGGAVLIVFGHPDSGAGTDDYFGGLMEEMPELKRLAHTDCPAARALELSADGRTASLHAWGAPLKVLELPFARWRPSSQDLSHPEGWLIRRAAEVEGSGGSGAMNRWQLDCQEAWLAATRPRCVAWPWENHPWERALVREARKRGIRTVGHQHTVIGPHMFNQSPASNPDGIDGLPDNIVCNGPAYRRNLMDWGVPEDRLAIGGALRQAGPRPLAHDSSGPVFVALSSNRGFSEQMLAAIENLDGPWRFLVKEHPMYPHPFAETEKVGRTKKPLQDQDGLAGVLYSTGTVGLEALLGGLPTLRFRPEGAVALDILPPGLEARPVDTGTLAEALKALEKPETLSWDAVLAPPDFEVWKQALCSRDEGSFLA